jgi:hypothetical protein
MKRMNINNQKGFSFAETIIGVAIFLLVSFLVSSFAKDIFSFNYILQGNLNAEIDSRHVVKIIVTELREAGPSGLGAYAIASATPSTIIFYTDVDNDGIREKVRYFISGSNLKRGVVTPTGSPLVYDDTKEKLYTIISGFVSSSTLPLFQYYPSSYAGTSSPLTVPVDISSIRLVKVAVIIDKDPNRSPINIVTTSQVSIRNLKDNL